jgi:hypothetical protein
LGSVQLIAIGNGRTQTNTGPVIGMEGSPAMSESQLAWHRAITRNNDWMDSGMVC